MADDIITITLCTDDCGLTTIAAAVAVTDFCSQPRVLTLAHVLCKYFLCVRIRRKRL